jgi:signal transduction histidine kinase
MRIRDRAKGELFHERSLAEKAAWVRVVLTLANLVIIAVDPSVPASPTVKAYAQASAGGILFLLYALSAWRLLKVRRISLRYYVVVSPFLDVFFTSILLIATEGHLSPFNLWFVFAVMASGFSRFRMLPFITAGLALVANSLVAAIPQAHPVDLPLFAVRTGYLFAIAAVLSFISSTLVEESDSLASIEEAGRQFAAAITADEVARLLMDRIRGSLGADYQNLHLVSGQSVEDGRPPRTEQPPTAVWQLDVGEETLGTLSVYRRTALTQGQESLGRALCDRAASALLRDRLWSRLTEAAVSSERLNLADRLHDTYLQSLAALDLRAEVARRLADGSPRPLIKELDGIKELARRSAAEVREIFDVATASTPPGPEAIGRLVTERWPVGAKVDITPDLPLSEGQWRAVEMVVREGLNNARKHGGASQVSLRVHRPASGNVVCALTNNGTDVQTPTRPGYGLVRLRTLVQEQGGSLRLESLEGGGATLTAEFELRS